MLRGYSRWVWAAAALAVVGRFAGLLWPPRPDEAGFWLVAESWDPAPGSPFGEFWVDRPPLIIAVVRASGVLGGPYGLRVLAALGCAAAVLLAAACARELSLHLRTVPVQMWVRRVELTAAVITAALLTNPGIDAVAAKGELLGVPVVFAACLLALRGVRTLSWRAAAGAGFMAAVALGLKQSHLGPIVFGGVLLLTTAAYRSQRRPLLRLAVAAAAGAAVPVALTVAWAVLSGVGVDALAYAVIGFRSDASQVILSQTNHAAAARAWQLAILYVTTGLGVLAVWSVLHVRAWLTHLRAASLAAAAMLAADLFATAASGSFWTPYLFVPIPSTVLLVSCSALVLARPRPSRAKRRVLKVLAGVCVASTLLGTLAWLTNWAEGAPPREYTLGREIGRVAEPGDTLVVYGGRADLQWASGLDSPYPYLWSLPMRTLDPHSRRLEGLLDGDDAPTWFVEAVRVGAWNRSGADRLRAELHHRYEFLGTYCGKFRVHHLKSTDRTVVLRPDCDSPWRGTVLRTLATPAPAGQNP